ncbi:MAG: serine hydrolase, partial [Bacteroidota bacterium]
DGFKKGILSFSNVGPTSLMTTARDLSKWIINFNNPSAKYKAVVNEMNTLMILNSGEESESGLGQWGKVKFAGLEWWDHTGSDAGYRCYMARFPESNSGVAVLSNYTKFSQVEKAQRLAVLYLREYLTIPEEEEEEEPNYFEPDPKQFISWTEKDLEPFLGTYWEPDEFYYRKIIIENDTLYYYRNKNSQSKLVPIAKNKFKMLGDTEDVTITFKKNKQGQSILNFNINNDRIINFVKEETYPIEDYAGEYYCSELSTSYTLAKKEDQLVIQHYRLSDIPLKMVNKNLFTADHSNYRNLTFQRDKKGKITQLTISNGGAKGLLFEKVKP